jgi:hypothetical protein
MQPSLDELAKRKDTRPAPVMHFSLREKLPVVVLLVAETEIEKSPHVNVEISSLAISLEQKHVPCKLALRKLGCVDGADLDLARSTTGPVASPDSTLDHKQQGAALRH